MGHFELEFHSIFIDFLWIYYDFSLIFSQFQSRGSTGIDLNFISILGQFGLEIAQFYYQFSLISGFETREIFHWNFRKMIIKFHWFGYVPLFQMWSTFQEFIGQFHSIWVDFEGSQPKSIIFIFVPLFGFGVGYRSWFHDLFTIWWLLVMNWFQFQFDAIWF